MDPLRRTNEITIFSHNGSRFDLRLIIKHIANQCKSNLIKCIAHNKETFYSLMIYKNNIFFCDKKIKLKFIDSSRHLPFSLHKLIIYQISMATIMITLKKQSLLQRKISYLCTNILVKTFYIY